MIIHDAMEGAEVAAEPGHFVLNLGSEPEPVIAWRVGEHIKLPVTRHGCDGEEHFVLYPDGSVRPHMPNIGSAVPDYPSLDAWRIGETERLPVGFAPELL